MADLVKVVSGGTTVTFAPPYEPRPIPTVDWGEPVRSEHQMRGGATDPGELEEQDFTGLDVTRARIALAVPYATREQRDGMITIYRTHPRPLVTVTLTDDPDDDAYLCKLIQCQCPRSTWRYEQYEITALFAVREVV